MIEVEMTVEEIESEFDDEWVLLTNPETDDGLHVIKGNVVCHSKDRDEVYRYLLATRPVRYAMLFTGEIPDNTAVVL